MSCRLLVVCQLLSAVMVAAILEGQGDDGDEMELGNEVLCSYFEK